MNKYDKDVRKIICDVLNIDNCDNTGDKDDLLSIGMDSLNCMQLVVELEEHFKIEISEEKLGLSFVRNIFDICKLIEEAK